MANDDDLFDLHEGPPPGLEKTEMTEEPNGPPPNGWSRPCPAASSDEAFKPQDTHVTEATHATHDVSRGAPGIFSQAAPPVAPAYCPASDGGCETARGMYRSVFEPPPGLDRPPAPTPWQRGYHGMWWAVDGMPGAASPDAAHGYSLANAVPMDVTPYATPQQRMKYPCDPHHKLRKAVLNNDRETLIQALHQGGGLGTDRSGKTAMHYAANRGHVELMHLMLLSGLNPNVISNSGHTLVDEAEYWVVKGSMEPNRAESCRHCRNLIAVFGGRRGYHEYVVQERQKMERQHYSQGREMKFPWEDDLDYIAKRYEGMREDPWWKPEAITWSLDRDVPPLSDHDLPPSDDSASPEASPERFWEGSTLPNQTYPLCQTQPNPPNGHMQWRGQNGTSVASTPQMSQAPPAPQVSPSTQVSTAPAARQVAQGSSTWRKAAAKKAAQSFRSLEDLLPSKFETMEDFVKATKFARDKILELQQFPRTDVYVKKAPVPPLNPKDPTIDI